MRHLARTMTKAGLEAGEASAHAAVTIAARWPTLAGFFIAPTAAAALEWSRAYTEKVVAAGEGALAVWSEWQQLMIRAAFRPPSPAALANDLARISHKAGHAARKRVRGNAKRLSRRRKSG
jgi:hypothetical protein